MRKINWRAAKCPRVVGMVPNSEVEIPADDNDREMYKIVWSVHPSLEKTRMAAVFGWPMASNLPRPGSALTLSNFTLPCEESA